MEEMGSTSTFSCLLALIACLAPMTTFLAAPFTEPRLARFLALFSISLSFLLSICLFVMVWNAGDKSAQLNWFSVGAVQFTAGILLNNLSVLMLCLVSGISLLVHIYSISYMKGDPEIRKYWSYLGLFCFSMLGLVIADNLLLIYMFWELVGFASYLLIGFWYTRDAASRAAKKAFIINRLGDLGFLCGLFIIYNQFGTFDLKILFGESGVFSSLDPGAERWTGTTGDLPAVWLSVAGLAFFIGAMAKSAQFPFHTWLPDAMEGPTSVSSLIHAATMVAAGVFLLGRIYPLFNTDVHLVMTLVGTLTAFMAATIALSQNDMKRILAFSTISQLGFMIMGMGIGAYGESMLHLTAHAFFKCLLFLAAGAVIHQLHHLKLKKGASFDHQDIREMGGLRKQMPLTFICMCAAGAALAGLPLTSGFLSKDPLLISAFEWTAGRSGMWMIVPIILTVTSLLTVFYISRLIFKVFWGEARHGMVNEAPKTMSSILLILAALSTFLIFSFNPLAQDIWLLDGFMVKAIPADAALHLWVPLGITILSIAVIGWAFRIYVRNREKKIVEGGFWFQLSSREWYIDRVQNSAIVKPVEKISAAAASFDLTVIDGLVNTLGNLTRVLALLSDWIDRWIVDGLITFIARLAASIGNFSRRFQTGKLQHYFVTMLAVLIISFIITYLI